MISEYETTYTYKGISYTMTNVLIDDFLLEFNTDIHYLMRIGIDEKIVSNPNATIGKVLVTRTYVNNEPIYDFDVQLS